MRWDVAAPLRKGRKKGKNAERRERRTRNEDELDACERNANNPTRLTGRFLMPSRTLEYLFMITRQST